MQRISAFRPTLHKTNYRRNCKTLNRNGKTGSSLHALPRPYPPLDRRPQDHHPRRTAPVERGVTRPGGPGSRLICGPCRPVTRGPWVPKFPVSCRSRSWGNSVPSVRSPTRFGPTARRRHLAGTLLVWCQLSFLTDSMSVAATDDFICCGSPCLRWFAARSMADRRSFLLTLCTSTCFGFFLLFTRPLSTYD